MENKYAPIGHGMGTGKEFQGTIGQSNNIDSLFKAFFNEMLLLSMQTFYLCGVLC